MPKFSIVIPTYNASNDILKTLDSIYNQTYKNFEVIIVDDLSEDREALKNVIDSSGYPVISFYSDIKLNGSGARNKGVDLSSGEYIALLDSDDSWDKNKLERYNSYIKNCNPVNKIFYSKVNIIKGEEFVKKMPTRGYDKQKESIASYLFGVAGFIQTSTLVLSRDLYLSVRFDDRYKRHQDYDFCIRADHHGAEFILIDEALSNYYISERASAKSKGESTEYSIWWLDKMSMYLKKSDFICYNAFKMPHKLISDSKKVKALYCFAYNFIFTRKCEKLDFINYILSRLKNAKN